MSDEIKPSEATQIEALKAAIVQLAAERDELLDQYPRLDCVIQALSGRCDELQRQIRLANQEKIALAGELERVSKLVREQGPILSLVDNENIEPRRG